MSVITITESSDDVIIIQAAPSPPISSMLLRAYNLSDVPDIVAARAHLGIPVLGTLSVLSEVAFANLAAAALATATTFKNNTANVVLTPNSAWSAAVPVNIGSALTGTVTLDFSAAINFIGTLAGSITLANPVNAKDGQSGSLFWSQGSAGGRTVSFGANWYPIGAIFPTFSTVATAINYITFQYVAGLYVFSGGKLSG